MEKNSINKKLLENAILKARQLINLNVAKKLTG